LCSPINGHPVPPATLHSGLTTVCPANYNSVKFTLTVFSLYWKKGVIGLIETVNYSNVFA